MTARPETPGHWVVAHEIPTLRPLQGQVAELALASGLHIAKKPEPLLAQQLSGYMLNASLSDHFKRRGIREAPDAANLKEFVDSFRAKGSAVAEGFDMEFAGLEISPKVRHHRQSRWLDEYGHLKDEAAPGLVVTR